MNNDIKNEECSQSSGVASGVNGKIDIFKESNKVDSNDIECPKALKIIVKEINRLKSKYNKNNMLLDDEIYYMNGNDGTDFDWQANNRTCEFACFYYDESAFVKLYVKKDGKIEGFFWDAARQAEAYELNLESITPEEAEEFAILMQTISDDLNLFNACIEDLDFTHKLTSEEYIKGQLHLTSE